MVAAAAAAPEVVAEVPDVPLIIDESLLTKEENPPATVLDEPVVPEPDVPVAAAPLAVVPDAASAAAVLAAVEPVVPDPVELVDDGVDDPEPRADNAPIADIMGSMLPIIISIIMLFISPDAPASPRPAPPRPAVADGEHELLQEFIDAFSRPKGVIQTMMPSLLLCEVPATGVA